MIAGCRGCPALRLRQTNGLDGGRRRPASRASSALTPLVGALLAGISALALLTVALFLGDAPTSSDGNAAEEAVVSQFFLAVNDLLAGGDPNALDPLIAPDVLVHAPSGTIAGREALVRRVSAIGAASPGLRFVPADVVTSGGHVLATVDASAPAPRLAGGGAVSGPSPSLTGTAIFRLVDGRIADYWPPIDDQTLPRALPKLSLKLWLGAKQISLARFVFPPGATHSGLIGSGPHLVLPETGSLTVALDAPALLARDYAMGDGWRPTLAQATLVLQPGDGLLIPAAVSHSLRNATVTGASMLGIFIDVPIRQAIGPEKRSTPDVPSLDRIYGSLPFNLPVVWNRQVTIELLARGTDACGASEHAALTVGWLPLAPGQWIPAHPVAGVELVAAERGQLLAGSARPAVADDPAGAADDAPFAASKIDPILAAKVLLPGDGLAFSAGMSAPVANAGPGPASATQIAAGPLASPPGATGAAESAPCPPTAPPANS